ncbi:hypothetical protein JG687_00016452 [Phytophthora cactorum]|uniref:Uncharacterized protein n=1 Tax=Phytophthora cactorum TaxID=29920 RepID=A0A329SKK6_9STRA|nr:hypothetical protein PC128_g25902 [Phytophthora cactorum]KAG4227451.1 hypothetical protein PC116_g24162 [Phytophthora cactorum]KAG6946908.1 hypothetical protein JG687_00016452 [Phytophthora cactorum]RAW37215.1 hypothetical protein PC110_g6549 [Phytophthora cactorum]
MSVGAAAIVVVVSTADIPSSNPEIASEGLMLAGTLCDDELTASSEATSFQSRAKISLRFNAIYSALSASPGTGVMLNKLCSTCC